ncbi:hypothetical protein [Kitasatospora sp. NPDC059327]|uniref:hypothetical protein n=1 Tax=Kitasatospora sp. NPDC059327 TaxID=3346803 RepID=UPI0036A6DBDF
MVESRQILSIAPAALAAAGVVGWEETGPISPLRAPDQRQPWAWRLPRETGARVLADPRLQEELTLAWDDAVAHTAPVRLALYDVPPTQRLALVARLRTLRPAVGAVFVADRTLDPEPCWDWPLRVGAVTADTTAKLFDRLRSDRRIAPLVHAYTLGTRARDCDLLVVSGPEEFALLEQGLADGAGATCVLWCARRPLGRDGPARLDAVARTLGASGWIVADLAADGATDADDDADAAAGRLHRLVRELSVGLPLDEAATEAGSRLTVAHPELVERRTLSDEVRYAGGSMGDLRPPGPPTMPVEAPAPAPAPGGAGRRPKGAGRFMHSRTGLRRKATAPQREIPRPGAATGRPDARFLQAMVTLQATGEQRRRAFRPGADHDVHVRVGAGSPEWHAVEEEFRTEDLTFRKSGARLVVEFYEDRSSASRHPSKTIVLPDRGASSEAVFPVSVGPDELEIRCGARVYHADRLVQRLELVGPVAEADGPVAGQEISVRGELFSSLTVTPGAAPGPGADRRAVIRVEDGERADIHLGGRTVPVRLDGLDDFRAMIREHLTGVLAQDADARQPGDRAPDELLRGLAQQGSTLFDQLVTLGLGALKDVTYLQVVSAEAAELWPAEFVYDYGYPRDGARLCVNWRQALDTGICTCTRADGTAGVGRRTVCPLGFWGIRLEIERRVQRDRLAETVVEPDAADQGRALRPVDSVLFAVSHNVRAADRTAATRALRTSFGVDGLYTATSWRGWRKVVRAQGPPLLLALPHNARDDGNTVVLEIGNRLKPSRLPSVLIGRQDILSDLHEGGTGPIVMLLGCTMAEADVSWQNVAAKFLQENAPVVVGTLVPTLGRQAAVMAGIAAAMLADRANDGKSVGELVRDIRRRLLALGFTLAMSIVAFGDARWLVAGPAAPDPAGTGPTGDSPAGNSPAGDSPAGNSPTGTGPATASPTGVGPAGGAP